MEAVVPAYKGFRFYRASPWAGAPPLELSTTTDGDVEGLNAAGWEGVNTAVDNSVVTLAARLIGRPTGRLYGAFPLFCS
jgi:hypothetical protein